LWKQYCGLIDWFDAPGCICVSYFNYLCLLVKVCFLFWQTCMIYLMQWWFLCIMCNIWMETNICWHLLLCLNSLEWWYASLVGFYVCLGSWRDPSSAWLASYGCSYLLCMFLCNITGSHPCASSIIDVKMKIDIWMSIIWWFS
jgi:hypothetical protein